MAIRRSLLSRILRMVLLLGLVLVGLSLVVVWQVGAWNLVFPSHHHDSVAPAIPSDMVSPAVLVFSKTNSFRHVEGIAGGVKALQTITGGQHWGMFHTENGAVFNENDLARFDVVVFLNLYPCPDFIIYFQSPVHSPKLFTVVCWCLCKDYPASIGA